jgi:transposase
LWLRKDAKGSRNQRVPIDARASLMLLAAQLQALQTLIGMIEKRMMAQHRSNEASKRLETIPGIGIIGATAIEMHKRRGSFHGILGS